MKLSLPIVLIVFMLLTVAGCYGTPKMTLRPGRCVVNEDCPQTTHCVNTRCEDIYHPRKNIINY